ncbi:MAG: MscL family protein, partial [Limosilactobacillus mucosae]|nr:MscL family protein [Limosilactobacillus mucosae]
MKKTLQEFKEFISRGNVMDMAVGVIIGSAFTSIVNALVKNLINPLIGI